MKCHVCSLTSGIIFGVIALVVVALSFATDQWINCRVSSNGTGLIGGPLYNCTYCPEMFHNRSRGLFRTCYPDSNPNWINEYSYLRNSLVDSICLAERGYAVSPGDPNAQTAYYSNWASYYERRIDMMRTHWVMFLLAIVLLFLSCFLGILGCWKLKMTIIVATALLLLISTSAVAIGMGLFHGYYYLEKYKIIQAPFLGFILQSSAYSTLLNATSCGFGFSYALGWIGLATSFIAFAFFLSVIINLCLCSKKQEEKKFQAAPVFAAPQQPHWRINEQSREYSFFDNAIHHSTVAKTHPIASNPYDLHLPTGIPADALKIPSYNQQIPRNFDVPMLNAKLPVNY